MKLQRILPYAFARAQGVVLHHAPGPVCAMRPLAALAALAEVRRVAGPDLTYQPLDDAEFDALLAQVYQDSAVDASDAAGADGGLASLADSVAVVECARISG